MKRFIEKHALITGGASGIGRATALRFLAEGALVSIIDQNPSKPDEIFNGIDIAKDKVNSYQADITESSELRNAVVKAKKNFGDINILFANAGIFLDQTVREMYESDWSRVITTNLSGIFLTCKYVYSSIIKDSKNSIITMSSSMAVWDTDVGGSAYMVSKAGVIGFTKSLALEIARYGVRVNAVCPGIIQTSLTKEDALDQSEKFSRFADRIPLNRIGLPEDVAAVVAFLASEDARHITGASILIDGGQTLQSWSNAPKAEMYLQNH